MRILVPLDGSALAERAIPPATELLGKVAPPRDLVLLSAVVPLIIGDSGLGLPYTPEMFIDEAVAASHSYLSAVAQRIVSPQLTVTPMVVSGPPTTVICDQALVKRADLIMLTSHGRTGPHLSALGSVAEAVARQSGVPTLIVRATGATFPDPDREADFGILVALDGSEHAETIITPAVAIAKAMHGAIHLARVLPARARGDRNLAEAAFAYLTSFHDQIEHAGVRARRHIAWGDPVDELMEITTLFQIDLVALATHGRQGLERIWYGSVVEQLFHHIALPVLLLRPPEPRDEASIAFAHETLDGARSDSAQPFMP